MTQPNPALTPATTLDDAYRACDHERPLQSGDPRYEDFSKGRGDDTTRILKGRFTRRDEGRFVQVAFLSHRGAGKTTELNRICEDLSHHFFAYYFEANVQLDPRHVTTEDLLLALVMGLEDHFAAAEMQLSPELIKQVHDWFSDVTKQTDWGKKLSGEMGSQVGIGGGVPFIATLKTELKGLIRTESEYRTQVREAFRKYPTTLLAVVNKVLDAARLALQTEGRDRELLVVIDNLDRYDPRVVDELLIKGGAMLKELHCHMIVTPPISLHYKPVGEPIASHFQAEVMNTIRLRDPEQPYDQFNSGPGRGLLLEALSRRMDLDRLMPDPRARDRIVSASGGAIRDLLRLVRESIHLAPGAVLDRPTIDAAARRLRVDMRDRINANGWAETLAIIAKTKQIHSSPACMDVLFQRLALKYNGDGWYDVHPLVSEIPEVQTAFKALTPTLVI
ncbi:MAG: hypothetical protein Q8S73_22215 [Deltaproteobacteria bacterium]|nr:hypothetical protein [Myxococcales bacterium]MDP3216841.1 hypothetical protein [Deltaproteobacteria bacterium]